MATRKSYSQEFKLKVIKESDGRNLTRYCLDNKLDIRMVRRWRAAREKIATESITTAGGLKRKCGTGRRPKIPDETEQLIFEWVVERRSRGLVVCRKDIQEHAMRLVNDLSLFKASNTWLTKFMQRYGLSVRRATTLFKLPDEEIVKRAISFKQFIDSVNITDYDSRYVIAMDETSVYMGEGARTTIDSVGASSIYIPSTGYDSMRITCILAIGLDGRKLMPLLISKGKNETIKSIGRIGIVENEKAWSTQSIIRKWVARVFPRVVRAGRKGLLIWDSASMHRAGDMKKYLAQQQVDQVMIPSGMTPYLQSLDIGINKPFKDYLRLEIGDYIENRMERNVKGNFVKPSMTEVAGWVERAWDKVSVSCVQNALRAGYLVPGQRFEDSYVYKHERVNAAIKLAIEKAKNGDQLIKAKACEASVDDVVEDDDLMVIE